MPTPTGVPRRAQVSTDGHELDIHCTVSCSRPDATVARQARTGPLGPVQHVGFSKDTARCSVSLPFMYLRMAASASSSGRHLHRLSSSWHRRMESCRSSRSSRPLTLVRRPTHRGESETFIMMEGQLVITAGDGGYEVQPGGVVNVPKGLRHSFMNLSRTKSARIYFLYAPGGVDGMSAEIGTLGVRGVVSPSLNETSVKAMDYLADQYWYNFDWRSPLSGSGRPAPSRRPARPRRRAVSEQEPP
ncbi:cupin domain-containing protein [Streptomyces sp. 2A115]|uniref:cupin domain-containing protein n=1 Tax=Streptomyces sp. 2A115 TaxID=3457439 RepID=UPI003FD3E8AD